MEPWPCGRWCPIVGGFRKYFRIADEVDYYEGESAPGA